jgi:hypothetical protein
LYAEAGKLNYFNSVKVAMHEGLELKDLSQIENLNDNTLSIAGQRILLYIRDTISFEPKFHFSNCQMLQKCANLTGSVVMSQLTVKRVIS